MVNGKAEDEWKGIAVKTRFGKRVSKLIQEGGDDDQLHAQNNFAI